LVDNISTVLPINPASGNPMDAPFSIFDSSASTGWLLGTYLQDEWKITNDLTLNPGLRFDQMVQYVDANQFSPRVSLTWKPSDGTTFHAGYARNFTPPQQVIAAPTSAALGAIERRNPLSNGFPDQEFVSQHCPPGEQNKSRYETHAC
jgi:outer membrane receptor protein involved in Fe transport